MTAVPQGASFDPPPHPCPLPRCAGAGSGCRGVCAVKRLAGGHRVSFPSPPPPRALLPSGQPGTALSPPATALSPTPPAPDPRRDGKATRRANSMLDSVSRLQAMDAGGMSFVRLKRVGAPAAWGLRERAGRPLPVWPQRRGMRQPGVAPPRAHNPPAPRLLSPALALSCRRRRRRSST